MVEVILFEKVIKDPQGEEIGTSRVIVTPDTVKSVMVGESSPTKESRKSKFKDSGYTDAQITMIDDAGLFD